jgi:hypothetical protein
MAVSDRVGVLPTPRQLALKQQVLFGGAAPAAFSPLDIENLEAWFDFSDPATMFTDAGVTPVSGDGDKIYRINDKSGNDNHASQPSEANRPLYKTGIQNSLSMGLGDGSDDIITFTNLSLTDFYCLAVIETTGMGNYDGWVCNSAGGNRDYIRHNANGTVNFISGNSSGLGLTSTGALAVGNPFIVEVRRLSNDMKAWVNGSDQTDGTKTDDGTTYAPGAMFAYGNWPSHIGEVLIFSQALTGDDLMDLRSWANSKWGIF